MKIDINELQLICLPGRNAPKQYLPEYYKAYYCWRETWIDAYKKEMKVDSFLNSNEFTRQDEILALFYKGECAALTFFKWVDGSEMEIIKHDSYFDVWTDESLEKLMSRGSKLLVCSQFTVSEKYRKVPEFRFKDLMVALLVERFKHSDRDAMTGTVRVAKNMGEATAKSGAVLIQRAVEYTNVAGERADLVGFYQDTIVESSSPGVADIVKCVFPRTISLVYPISRTTLRKVG